MFVLIGLFCTSLTTTDCVLLAYDGGAFATREECQQVAAETSTQLNLPYYKLECLPLGGKNI